MARVNRNTYVPVPSRKHRGAASEALATAWLLTQGYEVFRNASQHGPADLVAWRPETGELLKIDVTTGFYYTRKADGARLLYFAKSSKDVALQRYGLVLLVVCPDGQVLLAPKNGIVM